ELTRAVADADLFAASAEAGGVSLPGDPEGHRLPRIDRPVIERDTVAVRGHVVGLRRHAIERHPPEPVTGQLDLRIAQFLVRDHGYLAGEDQAAAQTLGRIDSERDRKSIDAGQGRPLAEEIQHSEQADQGEQTQAQPPVDGGMVLSIEVPLAVEREGRIHRDSAFRLPDYLIALP